MLSRRLQVLIDDDRYRRLEEEAQRTGASIGALVRHAIDARFASRWPDRRSAAAALLAADPMEVGGWDEIERELEHRYERPE